MSDRDFCHDCDEHYDYDQPCKCNRAVMPTMEEIKGAVDNVWLEQAAAHAIAKAFKEITSE